MDGMQFQLNGSAPAKLTSWKKEPTIQALKADLEAAKPSHDAQMAKVREWTELMEVKGSAAPKKIKGRSSVQPKLIRRQAEWRYSALTEPFLGSDKLFKVEPVTFEDAPAARQNELLLNHQFRVKLDTQKLVDDMVRAAVDEGTFVLRLGWTRHTVMVDEQAPVWSFIELTTPEQAQALQQALALSQANPREFEEKLDPALKQAVEFYNETQQATLAIQTGWQTVQVEKVIANHPTVDVLNINNVYIDPSCGGDLNKALFAVIAFETNKATLLKEGKKYKNLDRVNWEGNTPITETDYETKTPTDFNFKDAARKKVVAYEYWGFYDVHGTGELVPIVCTWIGDTIIRMEENPYPDKKIPLVVAPYLPVKRDLYGEPDAELLGDHQKIVGAVTRGLIDLLGRSANGQQGFAKNLLDPLNKRRYENGEDYEFNPGTDPRMGIIQHEFPPVPESAMVMLNLQNQDAEALSGVKSFSGGLSGDAYGNVATGIRGMIDAAAKREMAILRRLAKGVKEMGRKIISMNGAFLSDEEVVRITNEEFVTIRREELAGEFDLKVDISTVEVDNMKAQDLGFILQTLGPNADPAIYMLILAEICELKRMPVLAQKLKTYRPQPTPEQQMLQQLEIEKIKLEVLKLQSEVELNRAKAQEALAKKDAMDLDFVEQESGTKHARDLEKQRAQAQGNQHLQITKALTQPIKEGEKRPSITAAIGFNQLSDRLEKIQSGLLQVPA